MKLVMMNAATTSSSSTSRGIRWPEVQACLVAPWGPLSAAEIARIDARTAGMLDELMRRLRLAAQSVPVMTHRPSTDAPPGSDFGGRSIRT